MKIIIIITALFFLIGCPNPNSNIGQYVDCDEVEVEIIKKKKRAVNKETKETLECTYCDNDGCHKVLM